jgi:hypothetical protein
LNPSVLHVLALPLMAAAAQSALNACPCRPQALVLLLHGLHCAPAWDRPWLVRMGPGSSLKAV